MDYTFSNRIAGMKPSAIREILKNTADPTVIPFAAGNPAPEAFPVEAVKRITEEIFTSSPILALQYSVTEGYAPLREKVKEFARPFVGDYGDNDILITSGAQQGIELACKALCNEGDTVICEEPSFIGSLNSFRSIGARPFGIPMEEDGLNIALLEDALKNKPNVKMIYVIPNFQNPTGLCTSYEKRCAIYELAKKYGVIILEDDPYGKLRFEGEDIPTIKSMDSEGIVVYCGSFSKILSPGLRVGYAIAPKPLLAKMTVAKQCEDVHTPILSQMIAERFLSETDMNEHFNMLRGIYKRKSALMLSALDEHLSPEIKRTSPAGGLFIWCTLPHGSDMMKFCKNAMEKRVAVVPGVAFNCDENAPSLSFRLNYSTPTDEQISNGIKLLGTIPY